jgi:sn-glycerol 3-phosphate transport system substrate-binding protein
MLRKFLAASAFAGVALTATATLAATEIQWWHAMTGKLGEKVEEIASKFNASQSDYKVVPVNKGNYTETMTAAIAAFRAKQQPHIVQVFEVGTATMMAAEGAVYPVTDLMKDTGQPFDIKAYLPAVVSYYSTPSGDLLSLPFNSSTPVLWYNKDAFKKAGLDPNSPPKTWAQMEEYGKKLQAAGYPCGFSFGWQSWVMIENFSAWHNLPIGSKENGFAGTDTELTFNNDKVVGMIGQIADWQKTKLFDYGGRRGESLPKFMNQECPMWMNSSAYYGSINGNAKFEFGQAMLPVNTDVAAEAQNSIIGGATLWVLRGKPQADYEGVAKFFNFMSSPEIQADWHQATGYVPITTAAYELSKKQGFYETNPGTDTAIQQLSLNQPTANSRGLRFGNFVQIRDIINDELEAIWAGKKSAKEGLDEAVKRGNDLLRKFQDAHG